ncbi:TY5A, partial [Symbiodinium sp. KB8]
MVQNEWETSELSILSERNPIKFLGMELTLKREDIYVSQQGYIAELMRSHGLSTGDQSRIPVGKDDAVYELLPSDAEPSEDLVHRAQQATGELLWLSQRSRPDLSFACCILSSMSTRAPARVISMATKMLKYVNHAKSYHLKINWTGNNLVLFPDAAFAPGGSRSQTGWVIVYAGTPVLWRSSRQPTTSLSSAEAELGAILEGSVAMLGVEAMLQDMGEFVEEKVLEDKTFANQGWMVAGGYKQWDNKANACTGRETTTYYIRRAHGFYGSSESIGGNDLLYNDGYSRGNEQGISGPNTSGLGFGWDPDGVADDIGLRKLRDATALAIEKEMN